MDRLPALGGPREAPGRSTAARTAPGWLPIACLAAVVGPLPCGSGCKEGETSAPARVNAVRAKSSQRQAEGFCDTFARPGRGKTFELPELAGSPPPPSKDRWRWINVWATWCKPCIAELPLLERWPPMLKRSGIGIDVVMLSVDEEEEPLRAFYRTRRRPQRSVRVADPTKLGPWLERYDLSASASIPIHFFISPDGKTRCARAGAISESDFPRVAAVLAQR